MATYSASGYLTKPAAALGLAQNVQCLYAEVAPSAALTTSDVFNFGYLPINARVVGAFIEASDLDTNGSPTLTLNVGDSGDADRYFAASTVGQAGTASTALAVTGLGYKTTAKTLVTGAPAANAATGVAGTISVGILYVVEG